MEGNGTSFTFDDGVGFLTLNRPARKNALSLELLRELLAVTATLQERSDIKALIIRSAGAAFCSGHDLRELCREDTALHREIFATCGEFMLSLQRLPQATIAQVCGVATAAGCQLVAACDLAVAEEGATFSTPGVKIGIFCTTPSIPLARTLGAKRALEMLFTARSVSAKQALEWGLINEVTPREVLETRTLEIARQIASYSSEVIAAGKRAFYRHLAMPVEEAYQFGAEVMVECLSKDVAKEGIGAFLAKRQPVW